MPVEAVRILEPYQPGQVVCHRAIIFIRKTWIRPRYTSLFGTVVSSAIADGLTSLGKLNNRGIARNSGVRYRRGSAGTSRVGSCYCEGVRSSIG